MKYKAARVRPRLDELTFVTFKVRMEAFNGVKCIDHIDSLLSPCDASGYDAIGLQEAKRDKTSEIVPSRYRVYFSGDCNGVKRRRRRHEVGLAIADNADKDSIAIEYINTRPLKARMSIKSNFVTFKVAYAPTE